MVASVKGAVFYGSLSTNSNDRYEDIWLQVYKSELFDSIFGTAIYMEGNNVPITVIENTDFINNFGNDGAAISLFFGGGLYCKECRFRMDEKYTILEESYHR